MLIYEMYHDTNSVRVNVKYSFIPDRDKWGKMAHFMYQKGFKYFKNKHLFSKCYIDPNYTMERFQKDFDSVKDFYKGEVKLRRYKLLEERVCE